MANNNIEQIRKARRAKGTPFFVQRNYFSLGAILFGGVSWGLFELWPQSQRLKKSLQETKFEESAEQKEHTTEMRMMFNYGLQGIVEKIRRRNQKDEEEESAFSKLFTSQPDV